MIRPLVSLRWRPSRCRPNLKTFIFRKRIIFDLKLFKSYYFFGVFNESRNRLRPSELLEVLAPVGDHHVDVGIVFDRQL